MDNDFNGLSMHLGNLARLSKAQSRSISAENPTGEKGKGGMAIEGVSAVCARELGRGWKISPCINIDGNQTVTLVDVAGPGAINHFWITVNPKFWRSLVLRMYWDDETPPSVETPLGDFFCNGWDVRSNVNSLSVSVNPAGGFNSYWEMPFRAHARITIENLSPEKVEGFFYQFDYTLTEVPADRAYFHAQWRRSNPLPYAKVHTVLDGIHGQGHFVGMYIAWGSNNNGWWGEGEVKMYLDGDVDWPTYCGTGTEDYFGGAWCFVQSHGMKTGDDAYATYSTPYLGFHQVIKPDALWNSQQRFGMYRWHVMDPIRFTSDLRITIQALGWRTPLEGQSRYLPLQDDIASTAFWYQADPHQPFGRELCFNELEVI